jgi:hypothetical protein
MYRLTYRQVRFHLLCNQSSSVLIPHRLYPEWNTPASFVNESLKRALTVDSQLSSHPVQVECPDANYINEARFS